MMMTQRSRHYGIAFVNLLLFAGLFMLHYSGIFALHILHANPIILIPCLVAFSMFSEEWVAAFTGMTVGIFMDSVASGSYCFNTILFMLLGVATSFTVHYLFNSNIRSAIMLSLSASLIYFLTRWMVFHTVGDNISNSIFYLLRFGLPSVIYTNLFIVPLFYLQRKFYKTKIG